MNTPHDDLQRLYEKASAMEDGQPAPQVRTAVIAHAVMLAQSRTGTVTNVRTPRIASNWPNWKSGLVASVLLVPLLGILMLNMKEAPELQDQVAALPLAETPVASKPAAEVSPAPPRKAATVEPKVATTAKSAAPVPSPPSAPATVVADAAPAPASALERPAMQGVLGAAASKESRADRAEASVNRSRESAPMASNLAASPAPAMARAAAPAKAIAGTRSTPPQTAELLQAAQQGNVQWVVALLNEGASLQARDAQGRTALIWAAIGGHSTLVKRLLELGADRAAADRDGLTALQHARQLGLVEVAALLE
ncbi:MAG: ankyrin repeat domain-containing protein [Rhodoferax sp.]|nr:ankyrin repeat domain-containing protein [Rhodoferax sp.]